MNEVNVNMPTNALNEQTLLVWPTIVSSIQKRFRRRPRFGGIVDGFFPDKGFGPRSRREAS